MRNLEKNCLEQSSVFKFRFDKKVVSEVPKVVPVVQEIWKGVVEEQKKNELKMIPAQEAELKLKTVISDASSENERLASPSSALPQPSSLQASGSVDVKGFLSGFAGGKASMEKSVEGFMKADDDLVMKTEVNDPVALSLWELLGEDARKEGYNDLADTFGRYGYWFKGHMVSFQRGGRRVARHCGRCGR